MDVAFGGGSKYYINPITTDPMYGGIDKNGNNWSQVDPVRYAALIYAYKSKNTDVTGNKDLIDLFEMVTQETVSGRLKMAMEAYEAYIDEDGTPVSIWTTSAPATVQEPVVPVQNTKYF